MSTDKCIGIECMSSNTDFSDLVAFDDLFHDNLKEGVASSHKGTSYSGDGGGGSFAPEETATATTTTWYKTNILMNNYYASIGISLLLLLLIFVAAVCCRKDRTGKERQESIIVEDTGIQLGDADADAPFPQIT